MSANHSKVYVKFGVKEITIEGDEDFVSRQFQQIFGEEKSVKESDSNADNEAQPVQESYFQLSSSLDTISYKRFLNRLGNDFKNWLARLSKFASNRDKILAAAYYSQLMRSNQKFYIEDISTILKKHGMEIRRLSDFIDTFEAQQFIYKISDSKKISKSYKFTNGGLRYINNLYAAQIRTIVAEE
jgi:predicted ATPase